ncbi:unnamed protein product, partial [Owenia fusiformis]
IDTAVIWHYKIKYFNLIVHYKIHLHFRWSEMKDGRKTTDQLCQAVEMEEAFEKAKHRIEECEVTYRYSFLKLAKYVWMHEILIISYHFYKLPVTTFILQISTSI